MALGIFSRVARLRGGDSGNNLNGDLKKITESALVEIPEELFTPIIEASCDSQARREIMAHLRECLSETNARRWRRVHSGLVLAEHLVRHGAAELMGETAQGHHFDLVQKVAFLDHFECASDRAGQHLVRKKAAAVRPEIVQRLQDSATMELPSEEIKDTISIGGVSTNTGGTGGASAYSCESKQEGEERPGIWQRMARLRGGGGSAVQADLKRITDSGVIDIPEDLFHPVVDACRDPDSRSEIMIHLRACLSEPAAKQWRRVYAGLLLTERLLERAPPAWTEETAQGMHFDLLQQVSFLRQFELASDRRAQGLVRKRAADLHDRLSTRFENIKENPISPQPTSLSSGTEACGSRFQGQDTGIDALVNPLAANAPPSSQLILNGIVTVGHYDDTTSESSGGEGAARAPVRRRERTKHRTRNNEQDSPKGASKMQAPLPPKAAVAPVPAVDLLGL